VADCPKTADKHRVTSVSTVYALFIKPFWCFSPTFCEPSAAGAGPTK